MNERAMKAAELHERGYNCAQAVFCAFADKTDLTERDAFRVSEGLGAGCSDTYGTCGAVSAMALVMGMVNSTGDLECPGSKGKTYKLVRELNARFRKKNGATICREIKGLDTGKVLRSCPGCIEDAATLLSEALDRE